MKNALTQLGLVYMIITVLLFFSCGSKDSDSQESVAVVKTMSLDGVYQESCRHWGNGTYQRVSVENGIKSVVYIKQFKDAECKVPVSTLKLTRALVVGDTIGDSGMVEVDMSYESSEFAYHNDENAKEGAEAKVFGYDHWSVDTYRAVDGKRNSASALRQVFDPPTNGLVFYGVNVLKENALYMEMLPWYLPKDEEGRSENARSLKNETIRLVKVAA